MLLGMLQNINMAAGLRRLLGTKLFLKQSVVKPCAFTACRLFSDKIIDGPRLGSPIPSYRPREDESLEMKRARLLYQSRKRGMLENGLLLSTFASEHLDGLDELSLQMYDKLINQPSNDWDLYYWITENEPTPEEYDNTIMDMLKRHAKNVRRDVRIRQPDLKEVELSS